MNCEAHIIAFNESEIIKFTIDHYKKICSRIVIYDNYSTDNTVYMALSLGAEVQTFGIKGSLDDGEYIKLKNNCWKNSNADFVIVCDADEILYHPDLLSILKENKEKGTTIFKTKGISMYSDSMPEDSFLDIRDGFEDENYSKKILFRPNLHEIDYVYGCHVARPKGKIVWSEETIPLLHYKHIGGIDRILKRHEQYKTRLSPLNKRWNLGHNYSKPEWEQRKDWEESYAKRVTLSSLGII